MPIPASVSADSWRADDPCVLGVYTPDTGGTTRAVAVGAPAPFQAWAGPPTSRVRCDLAVRSAHPPGGLVLQVELWSRVSATSWEGVRVLQAVWTPTSTPWAQFVFQFSGVITPVWELRLGSNLSDVLVAPRVIFERVSVLSSTVLGDDVV